MTASALAIADGRVPEVPVPVLSHEPPPDTAFVAAPTLGDRSGSDGAASEGCDRGWSGS
jgi:hypothetical protein